MSDPCSFKGPFDYQKDGERRQKALVNAAAGEKQLFGRTPVWCWFPVVIRSMQSIGPVTSAPDCQLMDLREAPTRSSASLF